MKPGYGRNLLIPQGKAVPATEDNVAKFEARRAELEAAAAAKGQGVERPSYITTAHSDTKHVSMPALSPQHMPTYE